MRSGMGSSRAIINRPVEPLSYLIVILGMTVLVIVLSLFMDDLRVTPNVRSVISTTHNVDVE